MRGFAVLQHAFQSSAPLKPQHEHIAVLSQSPKELRQQPFQTSLTIAKPPISRTQRQRRHRSSGFLPTEGRLGTGVPLSSMKAMQRSTHALLSGSQPMSYSRVIFSFVMFPELCFQSGWVQERIRYIATDTPCTHTVSPSFFVLRVNVIHIAQYVPF